MKPRVIFLRQNTRFNLESAKDYGELTFLMDKQPISPLRVDEFVTAAMRELDDMQFDYRSDFLGMTGSNLGLALCLGAVASAYGQVNMLVFDAALEVYVPRTVLFDELIK